MATAATYQERKAITAETGACVQAGCDDPAASGSMLCIPHRVEARQEQREAMARLRKRRRRKRECIDCGKKLRRDERIFCTRDRIKRNRYKATQRPSTPNVVNGVVKKFERVAQRTVKGDDGRTRYHGQTRRGQQTHAQLDEQDLGFARREIARGETGLQVFAAEVARTKARDPESMPRIQRDGIKSDALGYLERAQRHLDDVLERHGHAMKRHGRRDGDEK